MATIPPEAFDDILAEIKLKPIEINKYRDVAGAGRSVAFGQVGRRCLPPDYSRQCWMRPKLYSHLLDFGAKYVDISFNAITVNQNYKAAPHKDKNNVGVSFLVAFGNYQGGRLRIWEGDLSGTHNIHHTPLITDFSKVLHSVEDFEGDRYSLVYYQFKNSRSIALPPATVKKEDDKYYFYRGNEKITRKNGLPHPLKGRTKKQVQFADTIASAVPEFQVRFE